MIEQIPPNYLYGIALLAIALILTTVYLLVSRKKSRISSSDSSDYIKALNALIEGNMDEAIRLFYNSVRQNTENIDAYIRLGDIFRQQGKVEKAIKVHRELLVRRNLSQHSRNQIRRSLVTDYVSSKAYDKALDTLKELFANDPKDRWAKRQQLYVHEAQQDWENAFKTLKTLSKLEGNKVVHKQLALYKVEVAQLHFKNSREKDGRIVLREAMKIDADCPPAYIYLGDSYVREERYSDASKVWVEFLSRIPGKSHLVIDRLQEVLYATGTYSEIERILDELSEKSPDNVDVSLTLSDIRARKGDLSGAIRLCEAILESNPDSQLARLKLIRLYSQNGKPEKALGMALELTDKSTTVEKKFLCSNCQYESSSPLWHCPQCGAWNSFDL